MKVLQSWLRKYVAFKVPPGELAERLTMLGLEFEKIEDLAEKYRGFVVGKVVECARHPNAHRLTVCKVNVGRETLQIVCGAPNVSEGQKVVVGRVGTTVPRDQHDPDGKPFVLAQVSIRGVDSFGMICSEYELDLGKDAEGILVLDETARAGQTLAEHLGLNDVVYDIEITPNRPDWLSHIGIAREIGVLVGRTARLPRVRLKESATPIRRHLKIRVEDRVNCPRFAARMIRGVKVGPSPGWLQNALRNVGLRPINNIVDVTNYVMLECGHPMHAFDYALLEGKSIVVRQLAVPMRFSTLDGKERELPVGTVMVCDATKEVSVAGVMGGANSEINDATVDVVLEAAYWNPVSIRRTARSLSISTDASQRFERGADPNGVLYALDRAAQLVLEVAGGELLRGKIDIYPRRIRPRTVGVRVSRVNALLGTSLTKQEIVRYLRLLDLTVTSAGKDLLRCTVPTYRVDLEREIDLTEEVARVHGYDNIGGTLTALVDFSRTTPAISVSDRLRSYLVGCGYYEAITNSMQDARRVSLYGVKPVPIRNPQNEEMAFLRTGLVPGLLDVVARNRSFGNSTLRFFEIGHVFKQDPQAPGRLVGDYAEEERLSMLLTGLERPLAWDAPARSVDFFDMKGEAEALLSKFALDKWRLISYSTSDGLTEKTVAIEIHGGYAGYLGQVKKEVLASFGIDQEVFVVELALSALDVPHGKKYEPLPRFPRVRRDLAFIVDAAVSNGDVIAAILKSGGELLHSVDLFDLYEGEGLGAGKKSLAYALTLMSRERTLTDGEIESTVRGIVRAVERECGGVLRSGQ